MTLHLGGGGGSDSLFRVADVLEYIFKDLTTWTTFPPNAIEKCANGVRAELGRRNSDDVIKWRDKKLAELLSNS